jgi:trehalose-phosphatase
MTTDHPEALRSALRELATATPLLVALDFDGTISPLVDDAMSARALPAARDALRELVASPDVRVALVSGRSLESLRVVGEPLESMLLVGSHGVEVQLDGEDPGPDAEESARREAVGAVLDGIAARADGIRVERKPFGLALHTRLASPEDAARAQEAAEAEVAAAVPGLTARRGKDIVEFAVRSATKGDGLDRLRAATGAQRVLYAGDDVTDEDAFAALRPSDVGIKVGAGPTAAAFRVAAPDDVALVLATLAAYRRGDVHER